MSSIKSLTQPQRLVGLLIDALIVILACSYLFGTLYPPLGNTGFWAYSALLSVLVGSKFVTPFYVRPADAIAYAVPAFISLMLVNDWGQWSASLRLGFVLVAGFSALIFLLGISNIAMNAVKSDWAKVWSDTIIHTRRPAHWENLTDEEAAWLDFLRNAGKTSELSPEETTNRTIALLKEKGRFERLLNIAISEPPRSRAILGALGDEMGKKPASPS